MAGKGQQLRHRGMWQVCGKHAGHLRVSAAVMLAKISHQMIGLVALPFAMADHDDPPVARHRFRHSLEETGVCGVGFGAVGIMLRAVDVMLEVLQFLWCRTCFAINRKDPRPCMVDHDDQVLCGNG